MFIQIPDTSCVRIMVVCVQVLDDLDNILTRFQQHSYSKAILFVDNAGADVLLGMVPFARELLKRGTKVGLYRSPML
jgi:hypothetical protein